LLGRTYEAGHYLDVYWIIGFALIYAAAACQEAQDGNRATASIAIVPFPHAKELENFVSTIVLTGVVAVLYGFKDHMHGYMAVYLLPPAVMGISFIGVKEWWSHRLEWKLHNDLIASMADLEQNKARLEGILEITPEAIITVNAAQRIVLFNKGAERIFGYSECEALGQPIDILIPDRFHQAHQKHIVEFAGSAKSASRMDERQEIYGLRKDGAEFPAEASISKINLQGHQFFTVILRDITQRKAAERALSHRVELEKVISSISAHFINLSSDQIHDGIRHGLERIGQFAQADRSYVFLFSENDKKVNNTHEWCAEGIEPQIERLKDVPSEAFPWFIEKISKHAIVHIPRVADLPSDATTEKEEFQRQRIQSLLCVPMVYANTAIGFLGFDSVRKEKTWLDEDINLLKVIGEMFTNMLVRRQAEETLEEQAIRDVLTDLYNRRYFNKRIQEEISLAEQKGHHLAVLICDLDHFKDLNDVLGHQAGDEVLKAIGKRINNAIRGADTAFRWGGDEIVVLLSNTTKEGVLIAAERIREGVIELRNESASTLDISIGVSIYPDHGGTAEELIRLADRALYIAKKGGDKIHIGEEEYQLDEETIKVVFQPVMDVRMKFPVGYEALSRDAQGKLSVLDLFKKYQAIGLLHELKILCFRSQMKIAKAVGIEKVFINVDFKILEKIQPPPIPSGQEVVLEISEAEALHDVENHLEIANQWRKHGYKFAIDDFGAGFISLPFIARLTPDYIKLDRSTVVQALKTPKFKRILSPLLLGLRNCATDGIIAEGIETAKELAVMKDLGIYLVQGYLFGKPEEMK
jgi:diguanylate cyclase (GGDEF)-like protein/PAS domain S-box-containing protein